MTPLARVRVGDETRERGPSGSPAARPVPTVRGGSRRDHRDAQELRAPVAAVGRAGRRSCWALIRIVYLVARPSVRGSPRRRRGVVVERRPPPGHARRGGGASRRHGGSAIARCGASWSLPGLRSPRWFATAERILEEQRAIDEADEGEPIQRRLRDRTASLVGTHPVIVASFLAIVVGAVAVRELIGLGRRWPAARCRAFPAQAGTCSRSSPRRCDRRRSAARSRPSPAVGALGALSVRRARRPDARAEGDPARRTAPGRDPDVPGAPSGCRSGPGRPSWPPPRTGSGRSRSGPSPRAGSGCSIALAVLPAAAERVEAAFAREEPPGGPPRFVAGSAVTFAVGVAAFPGIAARDRGARRDPRVPRVPPARRGLLLTAARRRGRRRAAVPVRPDAAGRRGSRARLPRRARRSRIASRGCRSGPGPGRGRSRRSSRSGRPRPRRSSEATSGVRPRAPAVAAGVGLILSWLAAANYLPPGAVEPAGLRRAGRGLDGEPDRVRSHLVHRVAPARGLRAPAGRPAECSRSSSGRDSCCSPSPRWRGRGASARPRSGSRPRGRS